MADEFNKMKEEMKKNAEEWVSYVDEQSDKVVKFVQDNTKDLTDRIKLERKKMELRSEIGEHQRALTKAYTRLGEAYYESLNTNRSMDDMKDVISLVETNRKLIGLLEGQLASLESGKEA
ncbi:MAG: hypothetical protein IJ225_06425 [Solobacterium sp.]|nr:hypothetical protein [Solobacterium sp.]